MNKLSKRDFLKTAALLWGSYVLPGKAIDTVVSEKNNLVFLLPNLIANPESAKKIGRLYLDKNPNENNAVALVEAICKSSDEEYARLRSSNPGLRREILEEYARQDFENGETVNLHGWILSKTEARLFALAVLASETLLI